MQSSAYRDSPTFANIDAVPNVLKPFHMKDKHVDSTRNLHPRRSLLSRRKVININLRPSR